MSIETLTPRIDPETREVLTEIEERVTRAVTIPDLIREGSQGTEQATGWGRGSMACALASAGIGANARGLLK